MSCGFQKSVPQYVMRIGYARVSTNDQTLALQRDALKEAGCGKVFTDQGVSGGAISRPGLNRTMRALKRGDTLVVWKLDRFGRSLSHFGPGGRRVGGTRCRLPVPLRPYRYHKRGRPFGAAHDGCTCRVRACPDRRTHTRRPQGREAARREAGSQADPDARPGRTRPPLDRWRGKPSYSATNRQLPSTQLVALQGVEYLEWVQEG
jgi:hypothetical protein